MKTLVWTPIAAMLLAAQPALAQDMGALAPIKAMIAAFNKGDVAGARATHIASPSITDEPTAPYTWTGPKAFDTWIAALGKSEAAAGKSDGQVWIGTPTRVSTERGHGYVIVPSTYTFKQKGRTMRETGTMTFAVVQVGKGWKIAAWTWSSPEAVVVD
jgi:hypothetical protein